MDLKGKVLIRFDGQPGPEPISFIEIEKDGKSINGGVWMRDPDSSDWFLVLDENVFKDNKSIR